MQNNVITYILNVTPNSSVGQASVNRVLSFEKALKTNGVLCRTLFPYSGQIKIAALAKIVALIKVLISLIKAKKGDVFILYGLSSLINLLLLFKGKIKILIEVTEYPYSNINPKFEHYKNSEEKILSRLSEIDGFITCSEALKKFYGQYLNQVPVLLIPVIVDLSIFDRRIVDSSEDSYVGYCGSLNNNKDGVPILIESFAMIANEFPYLKLFIAGSGDIKSERELKELVKKLNLEDRISFKGRIAHSEMPEFLANAEILALARPKSKQSEGGFPSKIGEYLAVGGIVVATRVGEIPLLLKDGYNAFMAEPDSIESFAKSLKEALKSPYKNEIRIHAKETSKTFDIRHQGDLLIQFLKDIY